MQKDHNSLSIANYVQENGMELESSEKSQKRFIFGKKTDSGSRLIVEYNIGFIPPKPTLEIRLESPGGRWGYITEEYNLFGVISNFRVVVDGNPIYLYRAGFPNQAETQILYNQIKADIDSILRSDTLVEVVSSEIK